MEIADRKAEPPENIRGDIARIYFYMDDAYPGRGIVSGKNLKLFQAWECERERRIREVQGNGSRFVGNGCVSHFDE